MKKINRWKLISIVLLLISIGWGSYNYLEDWLAGQQSKTILSEMKLIKKNETVVEEYQPILQGKTMPTKQIGEYRYLGEIRIESLNLELPIIDQWDYPRLKVAPSRYQGSYYDQNLIIAGHNYHTHFGPLLYIDEGAIVELINVDGEVFRYQVIDTEELEPTEISVLVAGESEKWDLTLFTCTSSTLARQIIRCKQIF
ncbi:sortase [Globicatella sulfidifaciens]|uniref:Sortase n=1 Tax=Globicatella sulfidifaciens TaxID=136093 RepID=A0A7X8GZX2_9LACT|nr:sortase [Globicatella sulfidifaciens]NLJ18254.1 sortase [Globicatella sulfidifaciens]